MPSEPTSPQFSANWELVEDTVEYEYRNDYIVIGGGPVPVITRYPKRREVRCKTYEATIQDVISETVEDPEVPAPSYESGNAHIYANPEGLSPVGNLVGQWRCDNVSYTKELSMPLSRVVRITWRKDGTWEDIDDGEESSSSANA